VSGGDGDDVVPSNSPTTWADLYSTGLSLGLRPNEFWDMTFMEFAAFSRGTRDADRRMWNHTSTIMAMIANVNRDRKRQPRPYRSDDFHPYTQDHQSQSNELTEQDLQNIASWRVNPSSPSSSD